MKITSEIVNCSNHTEEIFPCTKMHGLKEFIVLFHDQTTGVVIWVKDHAKTAWTVGSIGNFISFKDPKEWLDFHGTVVAKFES